MDFTDWVWIFVAMVVGTSLAVLVGMAAVWVLT